MTLMKPISRQEETVGRLSLAAYHLSRRIGPQFHAISQISDKFRRDRREHGNATEVGFQSALTIALFNPGAERLVPPHDVQNVPQHFEGGTVGLGPHCGRARIIVHACHFAEQVASLELAYRIVVGQVDRRINRNEIRLRSFRDRCWLLSASTDFSLPKKSFFPRVCTWAMGEEI